MNIPHTETFRLPVAITAPGMARERVVATCVGVGDDLVSVAALLTSELVTNAVCHPAHDGASSAAGIVLAIQRSHRTLRVEVHDGDTRPPQRRPPGASLVHESGWGLQVVAQLATDWGSHPTAQGKAVWFELELPGGLQRGHLIEE